jgi:nitrate/nitrite transport system permease protein
MTDSIPAALLNSFVTLLLGYIPAVIVGLALGFTICWHPLLCQIGKRLFQLPAAIPIVYFLLSLIILKNNDRGSMALVVCISSVWYIAIYTGVGLQQAMQNSSRWPAAISQIFQGLRFGLTMAWSALVFGEMLLGTANSIGYYLWDAYNSGNTSNVFSGMLALILVVFIGDQLLDGLGLLIRQLVREATPSQSKSP